VSGRSGSVVARHTHLAGWSGNQERAAVWFAVSPAQAEILRRALKQGGACSVDGELRSARALVSLGLGNVKDEAPEDGGAWVFDLVDGVELR
jgi:hypothetical protein